MVKIRNDLKKQAINPEMLSRLLYTFRIFLEWTLEELGGDEQVRKIISELLKFAKNGWSYYESKKNEIDEHTRYFNNHYQEYPVDRNINLQIHSSS